MHGLLQRIKHEPRMGRCADPPSRDLPGIGVDDEGDIAYGWYRDLAKQGGELKAERAIGRLRKKFLAVLGYDPRDPVAAVMAGARILGRTPFGERQAEIVRQGASASRMDGMIGDLLDLARERSGGGIPIDPRPEPAHEEESKLVVLEIRAATGREIMCRFDLGTIRCDRSRMGQLLSNLVSNAVTPGAPEQPVHVEAVEEHKAFKRW